MNNIILFEVRINHESIHLLKTYSSHFGVYYSWLVYLVQIMRKYYFKKNRRIDICVVARGRHLVDPVFG